MNNIKLAKQGSETFSQTNNLMYLATNDVQSGDYQQTSSMNQTNGIAARKVSYFKESNIQKMELYRGSQLKNNSYFVAANNKKKFTQVRRNSIINPQVYTKTTGIIQSKLN